LACRAANMPNARASTNTGAKRLSHFFNMFNLLRAELFAIRHCTTAQK
jgi:hypothetical protein